MPSCRRSRLPLLASLGILAALAAPARSQISLPTGFADSVVVGSLDEPVGLAFVPGSTPSRTRVLFVEQRTANVRLVVNGALSSVDPVGTVANVVSSGQEQGLLSVAVDPGWPARPYVYLFYTSTTGYVRISRFSVTGDLSFSGNGALSLDATSRYDVIADAPDAAPNHNGGSLRFGVDGYLYASLGDDASGCPAQDTTSLRGVILRMDVSHLPAGPGGPAPKSLLVAPGNPFATNADANARLVWALGFRNPFRYHIDPATGLLYVADVGQDTWEEIDQIVPGDDAGWPWYEGNAPYTACSGTVPANLRFPIAVVQHPDGEAIMSLGIFRTPLEATSAFPTAYDGDVFYSDYYGGWIRKLHWSGSAWVSPAAPGQPDATDWGTGAVSVSDALFAPDGSLWYVRQFVDYAAGTGQIGRIALSESASVPYVPPPSARGSISRPIPNPTRGSADVLFRLGSAGRARVRVYDLRGRLVRTLVDEALPAGVGRRTWDGRDERGREAPAGLYLIHFDIGGNDAGTARLAIVR